MKKNSEMKDRIIQATIELIEKSGGNIDEITTRAISEKAEVGVGLINYHFQTKENLIEICVQRIIKDVILEFKAETDGNFSYLEKIKASAKAVMDILMSNQAVSKISILGDFNRPQVFDNTMKTVQGFSHSLIGLEIPDDIKKIKLFAFVTMLQAVFLRKDLSREQFGFDFYAQNERDAMIDMIADSIFKG